MMRPYTDIVQLSGFLLEESWVLGITATPGEVTFRIEMVLTPEHPEYRPAVPGEQYCYRRGLLCFQGVKWLLWSHSGRPPTADPSGEPDYGQVDSFEWDDIGARLEGSWGTVEIAFSSIEVDLEPDPFG